MPNPCVTRIILDTKKTVNKSNLKSICDMIKRNESDVADIVFEI